MVTLIILVFIQKLFIVSSGYFNALMDLITPIDCLASWGKGWSKADMEANKVGYWGKTFPKDMWHTSKRRMLYCLFAAISITLFIVYTKGLIIIAVLDTVVNFFVFSASFELIYDYFRKKYHH